jgi:hypothetical protein
VGSHPDIPICGTDARPVRMAGRPALSLILCSRNDQYMGNSRWRLQTTLNYVARQAYALSREADVEVLIADWGSGTPLRDVLELSAHAAQISSFILIPPGLARELQKDSPFPEVLALNAAARRAAGEYIGRVDQDTLVGRRFLRTFFDLYEGRKPLDPPLETALLFANVRLVPYRVSVRCPPLWAMERYIAAFRRLLRVEVSSSAPCYFNSVGIWLAHRDLWHECRGYDERMLYMNDMEINMIERLRNRHRVVDLGRSVGWDFYHLEHYHPLEPRTSGSYRRVNDPSFVTPREIAPNGADWGLAQVPLARQPVGGERNERSHFATDGPQARWTVFASLVAASTARMAGDSLVSACQRLRRRLGFPPQARSHR